MAQMYLQGQGGTTAATENAPVSTAALQGHVSTLAHWFFSFASTVATTAPSSGNGGTGGAATTTELFALCETLTADWTRPLWPGETAGGGSQRRRLLRGSVFGARGRAGYAQGRFHAGTPTHASCKSSLASFASPALSFYPVPWLFPPLV